MSALRKELKDLPLFMDEVKNPAEGPWSYSWEVSLPVSNHGKRLTTAGLTVGEDTHIIAVHSWLDQVLTKKVKSWIRVHTT